MVADIIHSELRENEMQAALDGVLVEILTRLALAESEAHYSVEALKNEGVSRTGFIKNAAFVRLPIEKQRQSANKNNVSSGETVQYFSLIQRLFKTKSVTTAFRS